MKIPPLRSCLTTAIAFLGSNALLAQSAPESAPAKPGEAPQGEATLLTPFEVSSARDTGYAATETLAGTRLRTNLRDVGASLTILTPEFLRDLGVNSFDQALLYTPSIDSVEGDNTDANRQSGTQMRYGTGQSYSIRGFVTNAGNQSISHDFFTALEVTDNYNVERTTLSLGPNALLVGVGSPQGTAITSTKRAQFQRRRTEVEVKGDRWGSGRVALDHNQPVVRDRLALRLNLLHDQRREFRRYEGGNQERMTVSLAAKPFSGTTITLNHENYTVHTNASSLMWGFNGNALRWAAQGKPTVQFVPAGLQWTATRPYVDAVGLPVSPAAGVVTAGGIVRQRTDFDPKLALNQITANTPRYVVGLGLANPMVNERFQGTLANATFGGITSSNYQSQDPWEMLGLSKDTNLNGGTWDDPSQKQHGRWTQLLVEHKLADGLYLELGGNLARQHLNLDPNNFTVIDIDPNRYLPDGSPNPGYLVPYNDNGQMQFRIQDNLVREYRATLTYQLDLTRVSRWLGRHDFAGLAQSTRNSNAQDLTRIFNVATVGLPSTGGWSNDATNQTNVLGTRVYFVNGNVPTMPDSVQLGKLIGQSNGRYIGGTANEAQPVNLARQSFLAAQKSRFADDTLSVGWQGRWFDGRLVTVGGLRQDDTASYGTPSVRNVVNPAIAGAAADPLKQYYAPASELPFNAQPSIVAKGLSRTTGAVLHVLPSLSLTYSHSGNFLPVTNATWVDALGAPAPNSKGETKDYGVRLSLLGGRLSMGLSRFRTSADNQARNANGSVSGTRAILARLRDNYKTPGDSHFQDLAGPGLYPVDTGNVSDTWSYVAEGYELNIIFNPSRNWRVALTGSSNSNRLGTHLAALGRYLYADSKFQGLGTWRKYAAELNKVAAGQASSSFDLNPANATARTQAAADALYINQQADAQEKTYLDDIATTGVTTARNGKYAFNGLITRSINEGRLKGWSIGGNFRWRGPGTIGYQRLPGPTGLPNGIIDVTRPMKGKEFWDFGAMVSHQRRVLGNIPLRLQLNVQNLLNWQEARLVKSDYDTAGLYGTTNAIVPVLWELRRPRNYILTATFEL
ncbi:MAG: hypothetical protein RIR76_3395 [Verrucomicrobiota bacterium]|jgi:hypothetical protein